MAELLLVPLEDLVVFPNMNVTLTVDVGGSQSTVTHTQVVSPAVIGQLQPGAQVPVKVDPNDHSQLMIGLAG